MGPFMLGTWGPGGHALQTSQSSSNELRIKFPVNPVEQLTLDLILAIFGLWKARTYGPHRDQTLKPESTPSMPGKQLIWSRIQWT